MDSRINARNNSNDEQASKTIKGKQLDALFLSLPGHEMNFTVIKCAHATQVSFAMHSMQGVIFCSKLAEHDQKCEFKGFKYFNHTFYWEKSSNIVLNQTTLNTKTKTNDNK